LQFPVACTPGAEWQPQQALNMAHGALVHALRDLGADPRCLRRTDMQNPLRPDRRRQVWGGPCVLTPHPEAPELPALWPHLKRHRAAALALLGCRQGGRRPPRCTPAEVRARQAEAGSATAAARREDTGARVAEAVQRLSADGRRPTQAEVAEALDLGERTVGRYWKAALSALAKPAIRSPPDIGDHPSPPGPPVRAVPEVHMPADRRAPSVARGGTPACGPSGAASAVLPTLPRAAGKVPVTPKGEPGGRARGVRGRGEPPVPTAGSSLPAQEGKSAREPDAGPRRGLSQKRALRGAAPALGRSCGQDWPPRGRPAADIAGRLPLRVRDQLRKGWPELAPQAPHPPHQHRRFGVGPVPTDQQLNRRDGQPAAGAADAKPPAWEVAQAVGGHHRGRDVGRHPRQPSRRRRGRGRERRDK
jgi:hypothetical protein